MTVTMVHRELVYLQPDVVVVYDRVNTRAGTQQIWQLVAPVRPTIAAANATVTASCHTLAIDRVQPSAATSAVHDFAAADDDFNSGFRLDATMAGGDHRYLHVLSLDGSVTALAAEAEGVTITLASGGTARVVFTRDAIGASLTIGGNTTTLGPGVDPL
jgi:hypothetical protein